MHQRIIFHIDVNSAFLSWEAVYRIKHLGGTVDLRKIPSAVGGSIAKRHGIILAKSIPAKKYNIQTGEPVTDALRKFPELTLVSPNYGLYEACSKAFIAVLKDYSPTVEQYSIDEAFVDMTGTQKLWGSPVIIANLIKDRIKKELGFTVNIGISSNKLLAKMASDFKKPDLVHTLFPEEVPVKMWPLPASDLFFVGRATTQKLFKLGIITIGELAASDPTILIQHLKKHGEVVWNFAHGRDVSLVEHEAPTNKGYGNSTTISFDVSDASTAKMVLLSLAETVARRLRRDGVRIEVLSIGIKTFEFAYASHQCTLQRPTNITAEIHQEVCRLFDQLWDGTPIRHLGIHTSRVSPIDEPLQLNLFDKIDPDKMARWDATIDEIRTRYGTDAVKRAVFLKTSRIYHSSGGISKEKKTVDYSKEKVR